MKTTPQQKMHTKKEVITRARSLVESTGQSKNLFSKEQWDYLENDWEPGKAVEIEAEGFGLPFTICLNPPPTPKKGKK